MNPLPLLTKALYSKVKELPKTPNFFIYLILGLSNAKRGKRWITIY
jgi:hypothetical protein